MSELESFIQTVLDNRNATQAAIQVAQASDNPTVRAALADLLVAVRLSHPAEIKAMVIQHALTLAGARRSLTSLDRAVVCQTLETMIRGDNPEIAFAFENLIDCAAKRD